MTIDNKSERNYRGKCLGWPVTSYGAGAVVAIAVSMTVFFLGDHNRYEVGFLTQNIPFITL